MEDKGQTKNTVWDLFAKNVKPLKKPNNKVVSELPERGADGEITLSKKEIKVTLQERVWKGEATERWAHQHVQQLTTKEVKKKVVEGRIDLHGYTRAEAESALHRFLNWAQTSNLRFVLIITGKGGILKESIPDWFKKHPEFIVSFKEAQPKDGGAGAFYVHVRRMRDALK